MLRQVKLPTPAISGTENTPVKYEVDVPRAYLRFVSAFVLLPFSPGSPTRLPYFPEAVLSQDIPLDWTLPPSIIKLTNNFFAT